MKTNLLFLALGAALMFAIMTLFERNTSPSVEGDNSKKSQKSASESNALTQNKAQELSKPSTKALPAIEASSREASGETLEVVLETSTSKAKVTRTEIPEDVKKRLEAHANRRTKRFLKKVVGSNNPKLDTIQSVAEIKIRTDERYQTESAKFTDSVDFSDISEDPSDITPEQQKLIDDWGVNRDELNANLESNRQRYEDSLRNILSPEELKQYKHQESLIATKDFNISIELLTEAYKESLPDLNDYQHSQLDNILQQTMELEPIQVPLGSTLRGTGYSNRYDSPSKSERYYSVLDQIDVILSDQQRQEILENGFDF